MSISDSIGLAVESNFDCWKGIIWVCGVVIVGCIRKIFCCNTGGIVVTTSLFIKWDEAWKFCWFSVVG